MTFSLLYDTVLLCFACVETLCALELVHQSDVFYSSVAILLCCAIQSVQIAVEWLRQGLSNRVYTCSLAILIASCKSFLADRIRTATSWMRLEC